MVLHFHIPNTQKGTRITRTAQSIKSNKKENAYKDRKFCSTKQSTIFLFYFN